MQSYGHALPAMLLLTGMLSACAFADEAVVTLSVGDKGLVSYQAKPLAHPAGGDKFKGSDFIHPLKTPSGFVVTEQQPADHLHHFGLWWPWKYVETEGRKVLCWELQQGDGLIQAQNSSRTDRGFTSESVYIDRKAPGGPVTLLHETANVTASAIVDTPANGYFLDIEIIHQVAGKAPITITAYRYSGFAMRGTAAWNRNTSTVLTSEGKTRDTANFTRGRWIRLQGDAGEGKSAGVLLMSRPDNHNHPEKLRTWDAQQNEGSIFVNFNPVMDKPWVFEPGRTYTRNYRVFVYDGEITTEQAESLWQAYAEQGSGA